MPVYYMFKTAPSEEIQKICEYRPVNDLRCQGVFVTKVNALSLEALFQMEDPCQAMSALLSSLYSLYYESFPLRKKNKKLILTVLG